MKGDCLSSGHVFALPRSCAESAGSHIEGVPSVPLAGRRRWAADDKGP